MTSFEGIQLHVYGTSYDVSPGLKCTAGWEWFNRVKTRLGMASAASYAVGGRWSVQAAQEALGTGSGTSGLPTFPTGSNWPVSRRGVCVVDTYTNDVSNLHDMSVPAVPNPMTDVDLAQRVWALRALFALVSSGARVEVEVGVFSAGWTPTYGAQFSASTLRFTTTAGTYVDLSVNVPVAGYCDVIVLATDPATIPAAGLEVYVDGVLVKTVTSAELTVKGFKEAAGATVFSIPAAVRVPAAPGARTIRLRHAGDTGQVLYVDCVVTPRADPVPILFCQNPPIVGDLGTSPAYSAAQAAVINANRDMYEAAVTAIMADYPNTAWLPAAMTWDATLVSLAADGLHPQDRGMRALADDRAAAMLTWAEDHDPPGMYTRLA